MQDQASLCATSYYLPRAYNAPLGGALVVGFVVPWLLYYLSVVSI